MKKLKIFYKYTAGMLIHLFLLINCSLAAGYPQIVRDVLSPRLDINPLVFQNAYQAYAQHLFYPGILVDKTDGVLKKTLYSDVNAFRTVIIDSPPTAAFLTDLLAHTPSDTLPLPWTIEEIKSFAIYLPSVVYKLEQNIGKDKLFELTGINGISDEDKIVRSIFQLQTELSQRIATMDSYIVENRGSYKTFLNKIYVYNRITAMFIALGLLKREDAEFLSYRFPENKGIELLIDVKKRLINYLDMLPLAFQTPPLMTFRASLSPQEKEKYGYVEWLKEQLGDNLQSIILYGSATREEENFNDFDNWVVVKDLDKAYEVLKGVALTFHEGRVLVRGKEGKEVSLNVITESVFAKIFHFNAVCDRNIDHCKVLYGALDVYAISEREIIERSISSVYLRLKTLRAAALWIARSPEEVVGKAALFKYFVKNTQFVMNVCINYREGLRIISKEEIKQRLHDIGVELFDYKDDPEYIARAMIQTAVDSSQLHNRYLADRKPDFSFLDFNAIPLQTRRAMLKALGRKRAYPQPRMELESRPPFPVEDIKEILSGGATIFDFGSGAVPEWGMKITEQYPDVVYYGVDLNDSWLSRIKRALFRCRRLLTGNTNGAGEKYGYVGFQRQSFFDPLPEKWGKADIITLHSPFNITSFLERVGNGELPAMINSHLKAGGMAFILTEWLEWREQADIEQPLEPVPDNARLIFLQALRQEFGDENVFETLQLPRGYNGDVLLSQKFFQSPKLPGQEKLLREVNYGVSFFQVLKPTDKSNELFLQTIISRSI